MEEWHIIIGHCNVKDMRRLEGVVDGMKITDSNADFRCDIWGKCGSTEIGNQINVQHINFSRTSTI